MGDARKHNALFFEHTPTNPTDLTSDKFWLFFAIVQNRLLSRKGSPETILIIGIILHARLKSS